jgi:molecular chaperone DnaJ
MKDLYKILGVPEDADEATVKKAYRKLAKQNHPDATGGDKRKTERFKEVGEAYDILGDKQKRAEYDRLRHAPVGADGIPQGFDPDSFAQVFGGGFGRGGNVRVSTEQFGDMGDLFASLFGGGGGGGAGAGQNPFARGQQRRRSGRGADMLGSMEISFRDAALGGRRTIRTGSGASIDVQVPPGVDSGGRLRIPGHGAPASQPGGQAGDLHIEIQVQPDPVLRRNGFDIEMELPLTIAEATLGTKVEVPTVETPVRVTVPPGTSSGAKLRLRGKGIGRPDGSRGDQICRIEIVVPKLKPDDEVGRKLVEELARHTAAERVRSFG